MQKLYLIGNVSKKQWHYIKNRKKTQTSLTIFTKEKQEAQEILRRNKIKNFQIRYVSLKQLGEELHTFKYAFLLREKYIINKVSTPQQK